MIRACGLAVGEAAWVRRTFPNRRANTGLDRIPDSVMIILGKVLSSQAHPQAFDHRSNLHEQIG
jgi:hypothetical protein